MVGSWFYKKKRFWTAMKLIIEQINNHWTVNGKGFFEMSELEKRLLVMFLKAVQEQKIKQLTEY